MPTCAFVSFRLGLTDGVSVVARNWQRAMNDIGFDIITVAGEGPVDRTVAGLALDAVNQSASELRHQLDSALTDADLVVVENLCTIPLNLTASRAAADVLKGRPAILHHHDPPWQREHFAHITELPPRDPQWRHVTINRLTLAEMSQRGIEATCIYNGFPTESDPTEGRRVRAWLDVDHDERLLAHPVRAIPRKDVPAAVWLAEQCDATYWLWGEAEDGYDSELERILAGSSCRVVRGTPKAGASNLYRAADAVIFPSLWEGFGNPPIEAAIHRVPAAVGRYPVADELLALGFDWLPTDDPDPLRSLLDRTQGGNASTELDRMLDQNRQVAVKHLSLESMVSAIRSLLNDAGWMP